MQTKNNSIKLINNTKLIFDDFIFRCSIGKNGITSKKIEGDKKTPRGSFKIGGLYYRADREKKPFTKLKKKIINKKMAWCNDITNHKNYNKLVNKDKSFKYETLYRKDYKYNFLIPILYNTKKRILNKGSAIFLHLTKNYKPTAGCIAIKRKDFLTLLKLINKKTKIKIF
jgi:L,D-peptidoglycan transpeptidase YkuD (ErfK/YbiS/YcfS/YnhG family)